MRTAAAAILAVLVLAGVSACGGDGEPSGNARKGGSITVGGQLAHRGCSTPRWPPTRRPCRCYAPSTRRLSRIATPRAVRAPDLIPGLVREPPEVSEDGLEYSFRFRPGLAYSDGTRLRASDFERAVDRARRLHSPYAGLYAAIDAIDADDRSGRVVVTLTQPDATLPYALALPVSAPVPAGTPATDLSSRPPPGIGPYTLASVKPGERWVLRRARGFDLAELPAGNVDQIAVGDFGSPADQADRVAIGTTLDVMQELPPTAQLPEIRAKYADRYEEQATASTLFVAIDPTTPPFDDRRVRQAVSLAVDGPTLERLYFGGLEPGCNVLPSSVPGLQQDRPVSLRGPRRAARPGPRTRARGGRRPGGHRRQRSAATPSVAPAAASRYFVATLRKIGLAARAQPASRTSVADARAGRPAGRASGRVPGRLPGANRRTSSSTPTSRAYWPSPNRRRTTGPTSTSGWSRRPTSRRSGSQRLPTFFSERIDVQGCAIFHPVFGTDLASLCLR